MGLVPGLVRVVTYTVVEKTERTMVEGVSINEKSTYNYIDQKKYLIKLN